MSSPAGKLVYNHDGGELCHRGSLVYFRLRGDAMTEWSFDPDQCGYPKALINGEVVCDGHSPSHIVPYSITSGRDVEESWVESMYSYVFNFTMSMELRQPSRGEPYPGGPVTYRCWNSKWRTFDECPENMRASYSGTNSSTASFRVRFDAQNGEWSWTSTNRG